MVANRRVTVAGLLPLFLQRTIFVHGAMPAAVLLCRAIAVPTLPQSPADERWGHHSLGRRIRLMRRLFFRDCQSDVTWPMMRAVEIIAGFFNRRPNRLPVGPRNPSL